jgi:chromosome segregation ATPase
LRQFRAISSGQSRFASSYCDDPKETAMSNNHKTNSLTDNDLAAAEELALLLGVSSSELIEEFENLTPEQEAELEDLFAQANEVLPSLNASLDRMADQIAATGEAIRELHDHLARTGERVSRIEQAIDGGARDLTDFAPPDQT